MKVNPKKNFYKKISLQRYIMKKELLLDIIDECISKGEWDFVKNAIIGNLNNLKVYGYPFRSYTSFFRHIFLCSHSLIPPGFKKSKINIL